MTDVSGTGPRILAVHQGYELYGSDRTFISSLNGLRQVFANAAIRVVLPREGVLADTLRAEGFHVEVQQLWVVRKASGVFKLALSVLAFPSHVRRALKAMNEADVTYINTSVIFDYAVAARFARSASIIHVHEIPTGIAKTVVTSVLGFARTRLVYNSHTTEQALEPIASKSRDVVLNGVAAAEPAAPREAFSDPDGRVRILMIGRINNWKGQDLLVQALALIPQSLAERIDVRFAGAAFEDGPAGRDLERQVETAKLGCNIGFEGFVPGPTVLYQWSDLVVVPSKKPEPFGLVAVEAMANGRAVIAANHGGLTEIVVNDETGVTFEPNNAVSLAEAISRLCFHPDLAVAMGRSGRLRYFEKFTELRYQRDLAGVFEAVLPSEFAHRDDIAVNS